MRSPTTRKAPTTLPTVMEHSTTTPALAARPTVLVRSITTSPASTTRPSAIPRSRITLQADTTPPWAIKPDSPSPQPVTLSVSAPEFMVRTWTTAATSGAFLAKRPPAEPLSSLTRAISSVQPLPQNALIKPIDKASEALFALKPVTFRYKKEIDPQGVPQFGLVAEEVEKVNPALVVRDKEGKACSVRYDQVNAMCSTSSSKSTVKCRSRKRRSRS